MSTKSHPSFYSLFSMEKKLKPTYRIDISWWTFGDFGRIKKKENCHILRRREEFLSWRLVMHTSGLFLGLAQHLKQTTKLSSSDYGQKIFAWYYVLGVCIEKKNYLHIFDQTGP